MTQCYNALLRVAKQLLDMNQKIIIDFTVENETLKNSVVFENNPTVHDAIQALDSTLQMLAKADADGISDENFHLFTKELNVNDLSEG